MFLFKACEILHIGAYKNKVRFQKDLGFDPEWDRDRERDVILICICSKGQKISECKQEIVALPKI